jgi:hypothetical protein
MKAYIKRNRRCSAVTGLRAELADISSSYEYPFAGQTSNLKWHRQFTPSGVAPSAGPSARGHLAFTLSGAT